MEDTRVRVIARLRPVDRKAARSVLVGPPKNRRPTLLQREEKDCRQHTAFDEVYGEEVETEATFSGELPRIVEGWVEGRNATVFAYGPTGSGKTHTIFGSSRKPKAGRTTGVCEMIFNHAFGLVTDDDSEWSSEFTATAVQVYKEIVTNLLPPRKARKGSDARATSGNVIGNPVTVRSPVGGNKCAAMDGANIRKINGAPALRNVIHAAMAHREIGSSDKNIGVSSRSHVLVTITLRRELRDRRATRTKVSQIVIVDLAGSEGAKAGADQSQRHESATINKSLLSMQRVVKQIGEDQAAERRGEQVRSHVSYRDSVLTRLLEGKINDALTLLVLCVNPAAEHRVASQSAIKFAATVEEISCDAKINAAQNTLGTAEMAAMMDENAHLQVQLHEAQTALEKALAAARRVEHETNAERLRVARANGAALYELARARAFEDEANQRRLHELTALMRDAFIDSGAKVTGGADMATTEQKAAFQGLLMEFDADRGPLTCERCIVLLATVAAERAVAVRAQRSAHVHAETAAELAAAAREHELEQHADALSYSASDSGSAASDADCGLP